MIWQKIKPRFPKRLHFEGGRVYQGQFKRSLHFEFFLGHFPYDCREEFPNKNEIMDHNKDSDQLSKKDCHQPDCEKSKCCYVHKTLMPTSIAVITSNNIEFKKVS